MSRPARTYVIEEDEHLENLRKIIKRDFFGEEQGHSGAAAMALNDYLSNYKSNENQHFSQMVQTDQEQWRKQHWWIDKQDKMLMIAANQPQKALPYHNMLEKPQDVNGISTAVVKQDAKNSFFFNRDKNFGSLQTQQHQSAKKVMFSNCRFDDPVRRAQRELGIKHQEQTPIRHDRGWEGQSQRQREHQSPPPENDDAGQLMTWGQIENTPVRIAGSEFRIPETPKRQAILHSLHSKMHKEKMQGPKKSEQVMKLLGSLTPLAQSRRRMTSVRQKSVRRQKQDVSGLLDIGK